MTLRITDLQVIPTAAVKLLKLAEDDGVSLSELAQVIKTEPALAAKMLQYVNSAVFGLKRQISSIEQAISLLGLIRVKQLAMDLLVFKKITVKKNSVFDRLYFWQHCLYVAHLSRSLAESLNHPDPDMLYTSGLLHDIGKIVLDNEGESSYGHFLQFFATSDQSILDNETDFFGQNHTDMADLLADECHLPAGIQAVVRLHHDDFIDDVTYPAFHQEVAIVALADYMAWIHGIGSVPGIHMPELFACVTDQIDLSRFDLEKLMQTVDRQMLSIQDLYHIEFPNVNRLRANLIKNAVSATSSHVANPKPDRLGELILACVTTPHQSLDPDVFIPKTLEALYNLFQFDRVMLLNVNPDRRSLVVKYAWPPETNLSSPEVLEMPINSKAEVLLECLRSKVPVLVTDTHWLNQQVLSCQPVHEFMAIPVCRHHRFLGLLYADKATAGVKLDKAILGQIEPVANELGVALKNAQLLQQEQRRSYLDPLTGLNNRRKLLEFLEQVFHDPERLPHVAVGFIDIDNFKKLNDQCGHKSGDVALKAVACILKSLTRPIDCIGRFGGEEFVFIHLNSDAGGPLQYAERIRSEVETRGKILAQQLKCEGLTVSIGLAFFNAKYQTPLDLIEAADDAMYQAKSQGKNRVVCKN